MQVHIEEESLVIQGDARIQFVSDPAFASSFSPSAALIPYKQEKILKEVILDPGERFVLPLGKNHEVLLTLKKGDVLLAKPGLIKAFDSPLLLTRRTLKRKSRYLSFRKERFLALEGEGDVLLVLPLAAAKEQDLKDPTAIPEDHFLYGLNLDLSLAKKDEKFLHLFFGPEASVEATLKKVGDPTKKSFFVALP